MAGGIVGSPSRKRSLLFDKFRAPSEPHSPPTENEKARREVEKKLDAWEMLKIAFGEQD